MPDAVNPRGWEMSQAVDSSGVRAVAFDAVGTLIVPAVPILTIYRDCGRRHGVALDDATLHDRFREAVRHEDALDRTAQWRSSEDREVRRWRAIVTATLGSAVCFDELWAYFARPDVWRTGPAVRLLHEAIDRGRTVAVASNFDARLRPVLAGVDGLPHIDRVIVSSEVGWRKPAAEFFAAVVDVLGAAAGEILFVGDDRANDYEAARAAGMRAALIGSVA